MNNDVPQTITSYTQQKIVELAKAWMKKNYNWIHAENPDKYHEKLGFLYDFLTDHFPK